MPAQPLRYFQLVKRIPDSRACFAIDAASTNRITAGASFLPKAGLRRRRRELELVRKQCLVQIKLMMR
jgi:hypothetical protein